MRTVCVGSKRESVWEKGGVWWGEGGYFWEKGLDGYPPDCTCTC